MASDVETALGSGFLVQTAEQSNQEQLADIGEALGFLNTALLAFAFVAIFVGAFIITNTFRIIVSQRTRELALLRAIGATGRQVTGLVVIEALVVAVLASAVGVVVGVGLALLLAAAMNAIGFNLPDGPLTLAPRTVLIAMGVGIVVTVVAAVFPARKAAKIPPVAAMHEELIRPPRKSLRTGHLRVRPSPPAGWRRSWLGSLLPSTTRSCLWGSARWCSSSVSRSLHRSPPSRWPK